MSAWSPERLDALPENTVIAWEGAYYSWALHDTLGSLYGWLSDSGERWSSAEIVKSSKGSIRVVSVPTDALLGFDAVVAAVDARLHGDMKAAIRAAIAHVIGGGQ